MVKAISREAQDFLQSNWSTFVESTQDYRSHYTSDTYHIYDLYHYAFVKFMSSVVSNAALRPVYELASRIAPKRSDLNGFVSALSIFETMEKIIKIQNDSSKLPSVSKEEKSMLEYWTTILFDEDSNCYQDGIDDVATFHRIVSEKPQLKSAYEIASTVFFEQEHKSPISRMRSIAYVMNSIAGMAPWALPV